MMVAIFAGAGAGSTRGSSNILGAAGLLGSSYMGRSGAAVSVNAATGNLLITQQDEMLTGRGLDATIARTYNSLAELSDGDNGDNWQQNSWRRVFGMTGTLNTAGSTVNRQGADGSNIVYTYKTVDGVAAYWTTEGDGAHDKLVKSGSTWVWTDGASQLTETYEASVADATSFRIKQETDNDGYKLSYSYVAATDKLYRITTANDGTANATTGIAEQSYIEYVWSGNTITQVVTGYTDYGDLSTVADNVNKVLTRTWYDYSGGRLIRVRTDLTPGDNVQPTLAESYWAQYAYDANGRINLVTEKDGSSLAITYDASGRVLTLTQTVAAGDTRVTSMVYDQHDAGDPATVNFTSVTGADGQVTKLYTDDKKQLVKITTAPAYTGAAAQSVRFAYDADGNVTSVTDANAKVSSFTFDARGNMLTSTDPLGNGVTRTYGTKNELLSETRIGSDASGAAVSHVTRYAYDSERHLRYLVSAEGLVTEYRYTGTGLLQYVVDYPEQSYAIGAAAITEAGMNSWRDAIADRSSTKIMVNSYDDRGNLYYVTNYGIATVAGAAATTEGYSRLWSTYDQAGRLLSRNANGENAETFVYDGLGRLTATTDLAGGTTTVVFNDAATTTTITTASAFTTVMTYNKAGELISETHSGADDVTGTSTAKYDKNGRVRMSTDAAGANSYFLYDKAGRQIAAIGHGGEVTEYRYDAAGRVAATVSYTNVLTAAQITTLSDPNSVVEMSSIRPAAHAYDIWNWSIYDDAGRVIETIDGDGSVTSFAYDQSNRLIKTVNYYNKLSVAAYKTTPPAAVVLPTANTAKDAVSRSFYDGDGRLVGVLDGEGYLQEIVYDKAGQKVEEVGYATLTSSTYWASGTFAQLKASAAPTAAANMRRHYVYDGQGLLRFTVDNGGFATAYTYNTTNKLTKTVMYAAAISTTDYSYDNVKALVAAVANVTSDRQSTTTYNAKGQVATTVDVAGLTTAYTYDNRGRAVKVVVGTGTDARTMRNWYSAGGDLRYTVDVEGYVKRYDYDAESRLTREVSWANRVTATDTTTNAQIASLAAAAGTWTDVNYAYDTLGRRYSATDGEGNRTVYTWYSNGTLSSVYTGYGTPDQTRTVYVYDGAGRTIAEYQGYGEAEQAIVQYAYDGLGNRISRTDGNSKTTTYTYDERGNALTATDAAGGVTSYEYDGFGQVVKETDARGFASYRYYNNLGEIVKIRDAESYVTEMTYTGFGEAATVKRYYNRTTSTASTTTPPAVTAHANDALTSFTYDKRGNVLVATDAAGAAETYTYDAYGNRITIRNKLGGETRYTYDKRGLALTEKVQHFNNGNAADWVTSSFEYDARGNRTKMIEGDGLRTTSFVYDKANRLVETIGQAFQGLTPHAYIAYDARGQVTRTIDAAGAKTLYFYDDLGRQTVQISATGVYTRLTYDKNGNVTETRVYETAVTVPADGGSEEEAPAAPAGNYRATVMAYDNVNRVVSSTVSGVETGAWNGTSWVSATSAMVTGFQYDALGNVVVMTDANGNTTWSYYDKNGRKTSQVDGERYRTDWAYDTEGNVLSETRYANQAAAPSSTTTPPAVTANASLDRITNFTYDKVGNRLTEQRMGVIVHNGSGGTTTVNATIRYFYNALGLVIEKDEATDAAAYGVLGDEGIYYTYDLAGRLGAERRAAFVDASGTTVMPYVTYNYNGLDELVSTVEAGSGDAAARTTSYTYSGDKLASMTDPSGFTVYYKYDVAGRVTHQYYTRVKSDGTLVAAYEGVLKSYDLLGRVTEQWQATSADGASWTAVTPVVSTRYDAFDEVTKIGLNAAGVAEGSRVWQQQNLYDAAGRVRATTVGDGVWKVFGYDKNGNQTVAIASAGANLAGKTLDQALALVGGADVNATYTVFDKRNRATSIVEEGRQLAAGNVQTLISSRTYNAFGETATETDAMGGLSTYTYNAMGRMTRSESPTVQITLENGAVQWVKAAEDYYYDAGGRLVATRDANGSYAAGGTSTNGTSKAANTGNLTRLTLLAGTGYAGSNALVSLETHADGGIKQTKYDIHGDARTLIDEMGRQTTQTFDAMGRVTGVTRPGGLTEGYAYDGLGQRIQAWNNVYQTPVYGAPVEVWVEDPPVWNQYDYAWEYGGGHYEWQTPIIGYTPEKARTDYDAMGRVVSSRAFGGDVVATSYTWDASIGAAGTGVVTGGWVETDTYYVSETVATGKSSTVKTDVFARTTWKSDLGANVTTYAYDIAGRQVSATLGGMTSSFVYFNTGRLASTVTGTTGAGQVNTSWTRDTATYSYDKNGNRLTEGLVHETAYYTPGYWQDEYDPYYGYVINSYWVDPTYYTYSETLKTQSASYDALGRLKTWAEAGTAKSPASSIANEYDANGNVRRTQNSYYNLDPNGAALTYQSISDYWFRYDSMNRLVTDKGHLSGVAGDAATTIVRSAGAYGVPGGADIQYNLAGQRAAVVTSEAYYDSYGGYIGETATTESYQYNSQGLLSSVQTNDGSGARTRSVYGYDLLGQQTSQNDYDAAGTTVIFSRYAYYNGKGQLYYETNSTKKTDNKIYGNTTYYYYTAYSGGQYQLGSVAWSQSTSTVNGGSSMTSRTINTFAWYDSAVQASINYDENISSSSNAVYNTYFSYNGMGQLTGVTISDGKPRSVAFTNDELGQIIRRDETRPYNAPSGQTGSPHEVWYRFNGRQLGYTGNNGGPAGMTESASIADRQVVAPANQGTYRNAQTYGISYADFVQSYDPINSYRQGSANGNYTVRAGDTLSSIAQSLYGDSSLWYKIAEANGLTAASALIEGQTLSLPAGVSRNTYNASSFKAYDAAEALGDVSPTTAPKPPAAKKKACGGFGMVLLAVIAIAVTVVTAGAAVAALAPAAASAAGGGILGGISALAAGTTALSAGTLVGIGAASAALGSIVSQGIGVATGLQDKFSWKGVALAAIGGAVSAGIGVGGYFGQDGLFGGISNGALKAALNGATASAVTQGIGVVTGLQDKFSWAGVAAAGVGAAAAYGAGKLFGAVPIKEGTNNLTNYMANFGKSAAGAIANAATRTLIDGSDFGDNLLAALPDVIVQTVGDLIHYGLSSACFVAGTLVHTVNGLKPIEEIKVGDWVFARDEDLANTEVHRRRVTDVYVHQQKATIAVAFERAGGARETLQVTQEHPFWTASHGWRTAGTLAVGDEVELIDASRAVIVGIESGGALVTVHNFAVEEDHTYFVGESGIWVHNDYKNNNGETIHTTTSTLPGKGVDIRTGQLIPHGLLPEYSNDIVTLTLWDNRVYAYRIRVAGQDHYFSPSLFTDQVAKNVDAAERAGAVVTPELADQVNFANHSNAEAGTSEHFDPTRYGVGQALGNSSANDNAPPAGSGNAPAPEPGASNSVVPEEPNALPDLPPQVPAAIDGSAIGTLIGTNRGFPRLEIRYVNTKSPWTLRGGWSAPLEERMRAGGIKFNSVPRPVPAGGYGRNSGYSRGVASNLNGELVEGMLRDEFGANTRGRFGNRITDISFRRNGLFSWNSLDVDIESKVGYRSNSGLTASQVERDIARLGARNVTRLNLLRVTKGLGVVGTLATAYELGDSFVQDNYTFGVHTQRTSAGVVGGLAGAYAGAEIGATIGLLGGPVGVVVGGIVGGIIGGIIGDSAGRSAYDAAF